MCVRAGIAQSEDAVSIPGRLRKRRGGGDTSRENAVGGAVTASKLRCEGDSRLVQENWKNLEDASRWLLRRQQMA